MLQYNPSISGSLSVTGSLIVTNGVIGTVNGVDVQIFSSSIAQVVTNIQTATGSQEGRLGSIESFTSSTSARLNSIETTSASVDNLNNTQNSRLSALETTSASVDTLNIAQNTRLNSLEEKTGSLATTGSNTFIGTQTITGSLYISSDLIVQGSSSLQNITASAVSIGTNIINLNTANPAVRYAGLVIGDSGSIVGSGSFLYDSLQDEMLFIHRGGSDVVTSSVTLMGPETYDNLGNETYLTSNRIPKGQGNEHLVDSNIFDNGTTIVLNSNTEVTGSLLVMGDGSAINRTSSGEPFLFFRKNGVNRGSIYGVDGGGLRIFDNNDAQILTITSSFVGINTSVPGQQLEVRSADGQGIRFKNSGSSDKRWDLVGSGNDFRINETGVGAVTTFRAGGNVGVGVTNPDAKLQVVGSFGQQIRFGTNTSVYTNISMGTGFTTFDSIGGDSGAYSFRDDGTTRMFIDSSGNVGINTATPSVPLHVLRYAGSSGTIILEGNDTVVGLPSVTLKNNNGNTTSYIGMASAAGGLNFNGNAIITSTGNVGMGITNPAAKLHVVGSISSEKAYNGMDDGLVLHFPFSENTGTQTADRSQTGFTGTFTNGTTWGNGILGYGAVLDGANDYISVSANTSNISFGTNMTYSMWINVSSLTGKTRQYLIDPRGDGGEGGMNSYFLFDYAGTDMVAFTVGNSGAEIISPNVGMPTGVWHHVAATRNGSTWKIYLNGVEIKSGTSNTTALTLNNSFRVGTYSAAGAGAEYYFQGIMDEVKIYKRTLSANEIALQYYEGVPEVPNPTYTEIPYGNISYSQTAGSPWGINNSFPSGLRDYTTGLVVGTSSYSYNVNINRGVTFDLGSPKAVRKMIEIGYDIPNVDSYTVQYSNDNSNWNTIGVFPYFIGNSKKEFVFNQYGAVYARYWRWYISGYTERNTGTNYYTYETAIYT